MRGYYPDGGTSNLPLTMLFAGQQGAETFGTGTDPTPNPYAGQEYNPANDTAGQILMGYRLYNPTSARFATRDPAGYGGGVNLYAYCRNNPVEHLDPMGLDTVVTNRRGTLIFTTNIVFYGSAASRQNADMVAKQISDIWNGAARRFGYNVSFVINAELASDKHYTSLADALPDFSKDFIDLEPETSTSRSNTTLRFGISSLQPYYHAHQGTWYVGKYHMRDYAHELVHLLGLLDKYGDVRAKDGHIQSFPLPGYGDSIQSSQNHEPTPIDFNDISDLVMKHQPELVPLLRAMKRRL